MADDDDDDRGLGELASGFRKRTLVTAKLAAKMGVAFARKQLVGTSSGASEPGSTLRAAELVEELGRLKGLVMKFGQMASYLPGAMPPEAQAVLAKLQSETTAMSYARIAEVLRAELGAEPNTLFESFEQTPFAAASIGQVHRARLGGVDVAVKVQYPGVDTLLESDLDTVRWIARMAFVGTAVDADALVAELRDRMREECDYRLEAARTRLFKRVLLRDPDASVPEVFASHCAKRVLTTELVRAQSFKSFLEEARQPEKDRAALCIFRAAFDGIYRDSAYNGDPHPGNYLFHEDGRVTFLDFGCVRFFDRDRIAGFKRVALAVLDEDYPTFREHYPALGYVSNVRKFDFEAMWRVMRYLYRPFLEKDFRYSQEYVRESYDLMIFKAANRSTTAMPGEWLLLNRLQWGLNSVLAHLHAGGPFRDTFRAAVESELTPVANLLEPL